MNDVGPSPTALRPIPDRWEDQDGGRPRSAGAGTSSPRRSWRLLEADSSPNGTALVLLLILVTYALSATLTAAWAVSPLIIVRRLVLRRTVETQTLLGAIAAYLMAGMSFAFAYQALGALQAAPSSGPKGGNLHHLLVLAGERAGHDRETGRAHALCRKLLSFAGLLLLCAEEIDATTGQHLGNFPQAFTDLALLDALTRLIEMEETASKEGSAAAAA